MQYFKNSRAIKPSKRQINILSFEGINCSVYESLLPYKYSPLSYNFRFGDGTLNTCMGFEKAKLPVLYDREDYHYSPTSSVNIIGLWLYRRYDNIEESRDDRLIIKCANGKFYQTKLLELDTYHELSGITTSGKVNMESYRLNGQDVLLISSEYGKLWVYNGINPPYMVDNSPAITSMCVHYERLFATTGGEKNEIWFSDDFDPSNWNISMAEGGFIQFSDDLGRANKVISFLDHIYIFRDYGINRLTAYGDQSDFNMSRLFITAGRIYPDTIATCGDRVIFLAEDGLYAFDGIGTSQILQSVSPLIKYKENSVACYHNGNYYLAIRADYGDKEKVLAEREINYLNNSMIEYDIDKGIVNMQRGVDIKSFLPVNTDNTSLLLATFNKLKPCELGMLSYNGCFFEQVLPKYWRTANSDLGYKGRKIIREIYIYTSEDIKLGFIAEGKDYEYAVRGSQEIAKIKVNLKTFIASFYIKSNSKSALIYSPMITIDII